MSFTEKLMRSILGGIVLLVITSLSVLAEGPSVEETVKFIQTKFDSCQASWSNTVNIVNYQHALTDRKISVGSGSLKWSASAKSVVTAAAPPWSLNGPFGEIDSSVEANAKFSELAAETVVNGTSVTIKCETGRCVKQLGRSGELRLLQQGADPKLVSDGALFKNGNSTWPNVVIPLCDPDSATRVSKAINHLLELGGAKKSPF